MPDSGNDYQVADVLLIQSGIWKHLWVIQQSWYHIGGLSGVSIVEDMVFKSHDVCWFAMCSYSKSMFLVRLWLQNSSLAKYMFRIFPTTSWWYPSHAQLRKGIQEYWMCVSVYVSLLVCSSQVYFCQVVKDVDQSIWVFGDWRTNHPFLFTIRLNLSNIH